MSRSGQHFAPVSARVPGAGSAAPAGAASRPGARVKAKSTHVAQIDWMDTAAPAFSRPGYDPAPLPLTDLTKPEYRPEKFQLGRVTVIYAAPQSSPERTRFEARLWDLRVETSLSLMNTLRVEPAPEKDATPRLFIVGGGRVTSLEGFDVTAKDLFNAMALGFRRETGRDLDALLPKLRTLKPQRDALIDARDALPEQEKAFEKHLKEKGCEGCARALKELPNRRTEINDELTLLEAKLAAWSKKPALSASR